MIALPGHKKTRIFNKSPPSIGSEFGVWFMVPQRVWCFQSMSLHVNHCKSSYFGSKHLKHRCIYFSIQLEFHHPNWRTHSFQRGRYTINQQFWYDVYSGWRCPTFGLFSVSYMGCNPSHWRTHIFQDGYCTTNQISFSLPSFQQHPLSQLTNIF